ncbi:alpha/beta-hydrolase [Podospora aff. communis PSN243]|uniref:Alpha/beta-hydrolase n=1 Tax=Podospora aff. communis PSN243 TaxID=3040156 RepID=A0AAV9GC04_9PEZI|nr:alpha/beta-hydrolase [Podospora aff. communis PSN243]
MASTLVGFCFLSILRRCFVAKSPLPSEPIVLDRSGGFVIGGVVKKNPSRFGRNTTLSCDHGYMEYFIPWNPRRTSLVMWHSSSTQVWQNRWDGGEGFKDMFLRRDYPVYLWDAPRVGRAAWSCDPTRYRPSYQDQSNFNSWNFGPSYGTWWPDVQFPVNDTEAWQQATSSRYQEYDTFENVQLQARAAAVAADSGKVGNSIVYLTNSAAGLRAQLTATRSNTTNIKGIVAYESIGYVFPDNLNMTQSNRSGFGPVVVPLADFKKLAKLRGIQFVWGDHKGANDTYVAQSKRVAQLINSYGGNATVVMLGEIAGLKGSTHIPFADLSNDKVAGLLERFLRRTWLDGYVDGSKGRKHWR